MIQTRISMCVTNIVRHHDQDGRKADGAMHWDVVLPVLKGRFRKSTGEGIHRRGLASLLYLRSFKTRSEICKNENAELRKIRAIHRHSGGMIISPRLMNYVMVLLRWKRFICHVGRARDQYSFAEAGLVARRKRTSRRKANNLLHSSCPFNSDADEAESVSDTSKPREVKYHTHWRPEQDAVYWIHLSTARGAGLEFLADRFQCYYYVPVCAKRMRRKGCQRKWKERIVRQSTYTSQSDKCNTQSIMGSCEIQQLARRLGKPRVFFADVETLTQ